MKNLLLFFFVLMVSSTTFAQSEQYLTAMQPQVEIINKAYEAKDIQAALSVFERIASAEPTEWLPDYYVAYCHLQLAVNLLGREGAEKIPQHIEAAQAALDKANSKTETNSELVAMQGYIYMGKVWEAPEANGAKYSPKVQAAMQQAIAMDASNPRPHLLLGQNLYFTPEFWGGGAEKAKPQFETARDKMAAFQPSSAIHPSWGKGSVQYFLSQYQAEKTDGQ